MKLIIISLIGITMMSCTSTSGHPPHSHTCYTHGIYHVYTEEEYAEIQDSMSDIRFQLEELEAKTRGR